MNSKAAEDIVAVLGREEGLTDEKMERLWLDMLVGVLTSRIGAHDWLYTRHGACLERSAADQAAC